MANLIVDSDIDSTLRSINGELTWSKACLDEHQNKQAKIWVLLTF